ncbi:hypothetical protein DFP94_101504 [Fontibacillus phaseoli]|uniref:Uncharacterized protein n=1 Tax=Fontibacillus phaseoli TaxID=1416533 RepID=A0A369BPB8_9BACL|nr:hypothetical protein [Fontibacillus phaseoli]RCX22915.1 hypothetical protein DFP94_101504 [Fontibacillus phaseoli]
MTIQYREVKRKANVGERIKIVNAGLSFGHYKNGDTLTIVKLDKDGNALFPVKRGEGNPDGLFFASQHEYVVLEPIAQETSGSANLPEAFALFMRENAAAVRKYLDEIETPTVADVVTEPKPLTRSQVIELAKADIAELLRIGRDICGRLPEGTALHHTFYTAEFYVNREKRAVTALVSTTGFGGKVNRRNVAKATAKAAPDDVFHAEIGKAISLRRALGLSVPDEYVNAPKPDEPRVGAKVYAHTLSGEPYGIKTIERMRPELDGEKFGNYAANFVGDCGFLADKQYEVIDDTDVDYGASAERIAA